MEVVAAVQHDRPARALGPEPPGGRGQRVVEVDDRRLVEVALLDGRHREPLEAAVRADEIGHVRGRGGAEHGGGGVELLDAALSVDRDPVTEADGLLDVVRDEQHGLADLGLEFQEFVLEVFADDRVDRSERLVHQEDGRVGGQCAGHTDALALSAGKLFRIAVAINGRIESDEVEEFGGAFASLSALPAQQMGNGRGVLQHGLVREEADLLDHIADSAAQFDGVDGGYVVPVEEYPSLGRFDQPVHHLHGGRLATAGRSDERDQFTLGDLEGKVVDGGGAVGVPLGDVLETDHGSPLWRAFREGRVAGMRQPSAIVSGRG